MSVFFEILSILAADWNLPGGYKLYAMVGILCFDKDRQPIRTTNGKGLPHGIFSQGTDVLCASDSS